MADIAARLHHGTSRELPAERQPRDGQLEAPAVATFHHRDRSLLRLVHANARSRRVTQHCELQFQNDYEVNARQSLIWGGSFFSTGDDLAVDADIIPYRRRNTVESGFAQCESVQSCGWGRVMARAAAVDFWHLGPQSSSRSTSRDRRQRAF